MGIDRGIELASFASLPSRTGLGSSSTFSVALMQGLNAYKGKKMSKAEVAEAASRLEIELVGEPIGKQDQYAAAFGGFNIFQFNADGTVSVEPVLLDFKKRMALEDHILLFFTGGTRDASSVLTEQKANIDKKFDTLKEMADSVPEFAARLKEGDFAGLGRMLHEGWLRKKSLASNVSNSTIDDIYNAGIQSGAWGGKVLGAGSGGCVLLFAPPHKHGAVREAVRAVVQSKQIADFKEIPAKFVQSGVEVLFNGDHVHTQFS
jgi:D-glycero-alpha-D-manno-heptose-7-phosphate kinase